MATFETCKLKDAALDWVIAQINNIDVEIKDGEVFRKEFFEQYGDFFDELYTPSSDWDLGGPFIDKYKLKFDIFDDGLIEAYRNDDSRPGSGNTHLEAAMRAIVQIEFGDTVEIPDSLININ